MIRWLVTFGLCLSLGVAEAATLVTVATLNTDDQRCPYNTPSPVYTETWTNTTGQTLYVHRAYSTIWAGGNLTPKTEGWLWVATPDGWPLVQMGGAQFVGPTQGWEHLWTFEGIAPPIAPGQTLRLFMQCAAYSHDLTVWRGLATFWLYDAQ